MVYVNIINKPLKHFKEFVEWRSVLKQLVQSFVVVNIACKLPVLLTANVLREEKLTYYINVIIVLNHK